MSKNFAWLKLKRHNFYIRKPSMFLRQSRLGTHARSNYNTIIVNVITIVITIIRKVWSVYVLLGVIQYVVHSFTAKTRLVVVLVSDYLLRRNETRVVTHLRRDSRTLYHNKQDMIRITRRTPTVSVSICARARVFVRVSFLIKIKVYSVTTLQFQRKKEIRNDVFFCRYRIYYYHFCSLFNIFKLIFGSEVSRGTQKLLFVFVDRFCRRNFFRFVFLLKTRSVII